MKKMVNIVGITLALLLFAGPKVAPYLPDLLPDSVTPVAPMVKPDNTYGLDTSLPSTIKDKELAAQLMGLCEGLSAVITEDGLKQKPQIQYAANIKDIMEDVAPLSFNGKQVKSVAPGFASTLGALLAKEFPDGTATLDANARKKAADIFYAAAYGCYLAK